MRLSMHSVYLFYAVGSAVGDAVVGAADPPVRFPVGAAGPLGAVVAFGKQNPSSPVEPGSSFGYNGGQPLY